MKVAIGCSLALMLGLPVAWLAAQDRFQQPVPGLPGASDMLAAQPSASLRPTFQGQDAVRETSQYLAAPEVFYQNGTIVSREDQEAMQLAIQFRRTGDESEKEEIRKKLLALTQTAFKKKMDERAKLVEEAQARLDKIKAEIEQRKELEEKIIARRVADLLDDPDPLAWDVGQPGQRDPSSFFMGLNRYAPDRAYYGVPTVPTFPVPPNAVHGDYAPSTSGPGQLPPTSFRLETSNRAEAAREQTPQRGRSAFGNRLDSRPEDSPVFEPDTSDL